MSIAGTLMSPLIGWRNPQGAEDNWNLVRLDGTGQWLKDGISIVALNVLAIIALVESVAYGVLYLISIPFSTEEESCLKTASVTLQNLACSSIVTMMWGMFSSFLVRTSVGNVPTQEGIFRFIVDNVVGVVARNHDFNLHFIREEDRALGQRLFGPHATEEQITNLLNVFAFVSPLEHASQDVIDAGADFLIEKIVDDTIVEKFRETDIEVISFVLTRAVFAYVAGSKKEETKIPEFFKDPAAIIDLRTQFTQQEVAAKEIAEKKLESLEKFNGQLSSEEEEELENLERTGGDQDRVKALKDKQRDLGKIQISPQHVELYKKLTAVASKESQGSLLALRCWQKAIAKLPPS